MLPGGRPAAAKKDWMNTRMTFDSRAPHRSLLLPLIAHGCVLKVANSEPPGGFLNGIALFSCGSSCIVLLGRKDSMGGLFHISNKVPFF